MFVIIIGWHERIFLLLWTQVCIFRQSLLIKNKMHFCKNENDTNYLVNDLSTIWMRTLKKLNTKNCSPKQQQQSQQQYLNKNETNSENQSENEGQVIVWNVFQLI